MLFWLDELMRREGKALYGDLMERVVFNTLFGAQSPDGRHLRYYTAFDGPRHYFPGDTYCCPCNYRRAIATLPDLIYYRIENGLAVNLYAASNADVALEDGLTVRLQQETKYPSGGVAWWQFYSDNITDYYLTPYDLGYGPFVKFDHDFVGRAALEKMADNQRRKKVTLVWNGEDIARVFGSLFHAGDIDKVYRLTLG